MDDQKTQNQSNNIPGQEPRFQEAVQQAPVQGTVRMEAPEQNAQIVQAGQSAQASNKSVVIISAVIGFLAITLIVVLSLVFFSGKASRDDDDSKDGRKKDNTTAAATEAPADVTDAEMPEIVEEFTTTTTATTATTTTAAATTTTAKKTTTTKRSTAEVIEPEDPISMDPVLPDHLYTGIEEGDLYRQRGPVNELLYGPDYDKYAGTGVLITNDDIVQEHGRTSDGTWLYVSVYGSSECGWVLHSALDEIVEEPELSGLTHWYNGGSYATVHEDKAFRLGPNKIRDQVPGCKIIPSGSSVYITGYGEGFYYVTYNGFTGWISDSNIS